MNELKIVISYENDEHKPIVLQHTFCEDSRFERFAAHPIVGGKGQALKILLEGCRQGVVGALGMIPR